MKQLCDLTLTSLTISELSPVMLLITRRCISTFTEILSRLNDSHFFLAPPEAAADGIEATSNMSHNVNRDSFSLLNACDIYEASLLKAKTGALSPHFCYDLLTVLVDTIKSSQLFVPSQDSGDCNVYSSTSQSNAHSEEILFPNFQVLRQYLKQWMETKGRNLGDFGKKNSIKRHRVLKPTSTKTVSSIEADISTVTGTHANDAVGPSVNISFADNILSSADVEVYSDEADSGSDEKRRRIDEYNDLNLSLDHEN